MSRKLKVFVGNYDGRRFAAVAATSQRAAADLIGTSLHDFRNYYQEAGEVSDANIALEVPGTVFCREMLAGGVWVPRT